MNTAFSPADESKIIEDYVRIAHAVVYRFTNGYSAEHDDLFQECMLVLIQHMNESKTLEDARHIQVMDMVNAMCRYLISTKPLRYPKDTKHFKAIMHTSVIAMSIQEAVTPAQDDLQLNAFYLSLSQEQRNIIDLRLCGYSLAAIARETGTEYTVIRRQMKAIRKTYCMN